MGRGACPETERTSLTIDQEDVEGFLEAFEALLADAGRRESEIDNLGCFNR